MKFTDFTIQKQIYLLNDIVWYCYFYFGMKFLNSIWKFLI